MKKSVGLWELMGFAITSFLGTILHFLYDWTGGSVFVAPFSGINESTWEHMKLFFWPTFLFAIVQSFFFKDYKEFWCVKLKGMLIGLTLIPVIFYTYNGAIGKSPDWLNITIFFASAAVAYLYQTRQLNKGAPCKHPRLAIFILCTLAFLFVLFTFRVPEINIFKDPLI